MQHPCHPARARQTEQIEPPPRLGVGQRAAEDEDLAGVLQCAVKRIETRLQRPVHQPELAAERPLHDTALPERDAPQIEEQEIGRRVLVESPEAVVLDGLVGEMRRHHRQRRQHRRVRIPVHVVPLGHLPRHHAAAEEMRLVVREPRASARDARARDGQELVRERLPSVIPVRLIEVIDRPPDVLQIALESAIEDVLVLANQAEDVEALVEDFADWIERGIAAIGLAGVKPVDHARLRVGPRRVAMVERFQRLASGRGADAGQQEAGTMMRHISSDEP